MTLVDTDVLIDELRQVPLAQQVLQAAARQGTLAVSMLTRLELLVGCRDLVSKQRVERLLRGFQLLPVTAEISETTNQLVTTYWLGHSLHFVDAHIAATAIVHDRPLLTKNQRDFRFIPGLQLLPYPPTPA